MKRATIKDLHLVAPERKPGYLEACRKLGRPSPDGQSLHFTDADHAALRRDFRIAPSIRLGDALHKIAGPIGRAIRWPCLKGDGTTDLKPGSPCDRARRALNNLAGRRS